jgi:hypothetical protein
MSLFAEQSRNAFLAQQMGVGQCVNKVNLTGEHFMVGEKCGHKFVHHSDKNHRHDIHAALQTEDDTR